MSMRKRSPRRLPTWKKLVNYLEAQNDDRLDEIIELAKTGFYDDYRTPIAMPIHQLVMDLEEAGFLGLARMAKDGQWDAEPWEGEEWMKTEGHKLLMEDVENENKATQSKQ